MNTSRFTHSAGIGLMVAGVVIAVGLVMHPDTTAPGFSFDSLWVVIHVAVGVALAVLALGFAGFAAVTDFKTSTLASCSFMFASLTSALLSGLALFVEGLIVPTLAVSEPSLLADNGPLMGGMFGLSFMLLMVAMSVASIMSGYFMTKIHDDLKYSGYLFFTFPLIGFSEFVPHVLFMVAGVSFGIAVFMLGKHMKQV